MNVGKMKANSGNKLNQKRQISFIRQSAKKDANGKQFELHLTMEEDQAVGKKKRVCLRCGREYDNPIPEVVDPTRTQKEIATSEWCADCNRLAMSVLFRESSVYRTRELYDPLRSRIKLR